MKRFLVRAMFLMAASVSVSVSVPAPAGAQSASAPTDPADFVYVKNHITEMSGDGTAMTKIVIGLGSRGGIYKGSTGLVYLGSSTSKYVSDPAGVRIRFRVDEVEEDECTATIFEGRPTADQLSQNKRVVLRAAKTPPSTDDVKYSDTEPLKTRTTEYSTSGSDVVDRITVDAGANKGVFVGSVVRVYSGSTKKFLGDASKTEIRYRIDSVTPTEASGKLIQGQPTLETMRANRSVSLRVAEFEYKKTRFTEYSISGQTPGVPDKLVIGIGRKQNLYRGAHGWIYAGDSSKYLTDASGTVIRFRIEALRDGEADAKIIEGKPTLDQLQNNRLVRVQAVED